MSRSSRGVISMAVIVDPRPRTLVYLLEDLSGTMQHRTHHDLDHDEHDQEREVEHSRGRDDAADRSDDRLGELQQNALHAREARTRADRGEGQDRASNEYEQIDVQGRAENLLHERTV